jgi:hypothetical protein
MLVPVRSGHVGAAFKLTAPCRAPDAAGGAITRGYRWGLGEVLDMRTSARLASFESATFGNESHLPNEPPS